MRRNAENLIILSGSEPARRWRGPIDLTEVVRASVEEVKEHTRVELLPLDQVQLAGHAAADVMHLLAELIENAVTFSAPAPRPWWPASRCPPATCSRSRTRAWA